MKIKECNERTQDCSIIFFSKQNIDGCYAVQTIFTVQGYAVVRGWFSQRTCGRCSCTCGCRKYLLYFFACIYEITQASNMRSIAMVYGLYNLYILIHGYPKIWFGPFQDHREFLDWIEPISGSWLEGVVYVSPSMTGNRFEFLTHLRTSHLLISTIIELNNTST